MIAIGPFSPIFGVELPLPTSHRGKSELRIGRIPDCVATSGEIRLSSGVPPSHRLAGKISTPLGFGPHRRARRKRGRTRNRARPRRPATMGGGWTGRLDGSRRRSLEAVHCSRGRWRQNVGIFAFPLASVVVQSHCKGRTRRHVAVLTTHRRGDFVGFTSGSPSRRQECGPTRQAGVGVFTDLPKYSAGIITAQVPNYNPARLSPVRSRRRPWREVSKQSRDGRSPAK